MLDINIIIKLMHKYLQRKILYVQKEKYKGIAMRIQTWEKTIVISN